MFGSVTLDVAIALVLVYSLLSLICSTINEAITTFMALRASTLRSALTNLLGDDLAQSTYSHHLVQGLVKKGGLGRLMTWKKKPSYIQTPTFVLTALDTLGRMASGKFPATVADVRAGAMKVTDPDVQKALLALIDDSAGNFDDLKTNLGTWYDHSMERVSGWYKRKVQIIIRVIALLVAFGLGVDTLKIVAVLQANPALRAGMVVAAQKAVTTPPGDRPASQTVPENNAATDQDLQKEIARLRDLQTRFSDLGLPSFPLTDFEKEWKADKPNESVPDWFHQLGWWLRWHLLGFFITTVAISLGAPFWFDLLNKLVSLRSSGQRPATQPAK